MRVPRPDRTIAPAAGSALAHLYEVTLSILADDGLGRIASQKTRMRIVTELIRHASHGVETPREGARRPERGVAARPPSPL